MSAHRLGHSSRCRTRSACRAAAPDGSVTDREVPVVAADGLVAGGPGAVVEGETVRGDRAEEDDAGDGGDTDEGQQGDDEGGAHDGHGDCLSTSVEILLM